MQNFDINEFRLLTNQKRPATMRLSKGFITFSKAVSYRLKNPRYVQILVQSDKRLVAIRACNSDDEEAIPFAKSPDSVIVNLRRKNIYREVSRLIIGFDANSDESVCIDGEYHEEGNLFIFNTREFYSTRGELLMQGVDNILPEQISGITATWA